jgi:hypothetical protein
MSRTARATLVVAALALTAAGSAVAADRPDDQAGPIGVGAVALAGTSDLDRAVAVRPDDRAVRGAGSIDDAAPAPVVVVAPASTGFDWTDAAIGAIGGIAAAVLAGALGLAAVRARQGGHATA